MTSASSTNIATLIAADRLETGAISEAEDRLRTVGGEPEGHHWLETGKAIDLSFGGDIAAVRQALQPLEGQFDICVQPSTNRRKMLLVSDMDSTIITVECIDELADYAGIKAEIAEITERDDVQRHAAGSELRVEVVIARHDFGGVLFVGGCGAGAGHGRPPC